MTVPADRPATPGPTDTEVRDLFGDSVQITPLADEGSMGRRITGADLSDPLTPRQARCLVDLLDTHSIISFPEQDTHQFDVHSLERLANHFGAVLPHPRNYANYGAPAAELELLPNDQKFSTRVNQAFPDELECLAGADSPGVYIVTNLIGSGPAMTPETVGGQHWHTDIEFEPVPLSTSMFFVQHVPTARETSQGTWVDNPPRADGFYHPESSAELAELREALPLNGETAYADTAAAYAALSPDEQEMLDAVKVRRRFRRDDEGWLMPIVHTNPRTGRKSLHSPVWASRGDTIAPVEVDGMSEDESRRFLDVMEQQCLRPEFRYDHVHAPGDVTIWSNFATLHTAPPSKKKVNSTADARLMYRISCKGEPSHALPRSDADEWIEANISPPYRSPISA